MIFDTVLALTPLAVLAGGLMALNLSTVRAAALALLPLLAFTLWFRGEAGLSGIWLRAGADAAILSATVGYTLFFGLLLYRQIEGSGALEILLGMVRSLGRNPVERLAWVLLVFGPLFESISGFGLAVVIVVPMLLALGYSPIRAMGLALISQLAVPWGALAIGMAMGAAMVNLPLAEVGAATALLATPGFLAFWMMALWLAHREKPLGAGATLRSLPGLAIFALGVWMANRFFSPELGGAAGAFFLALWLLLTGGGRQTKPGEKPPSLADTAEAAAPYLALIALLVVSRYHDSLRGWLTSHWVLRIPGGEFTLPLLYNPGTSLLLACGVAWWRARRRAAGWNPMEGPRFTGILLGAGRQWWGAFSAVLLLVLLARGMLESGMVTRLAAGVAALPPLLGTAALPFVSGLGGFLTGSVAGANALFIDFQVEVAAQLGLPVLWVVALQNMMAAAFTAFSPARIVFAAVMTELPGKEGETMRSLLPLAAALLVIGVLALLPWAREGLETLRPWVVGP